jgi:hypothetical protein
MSLGMYASAPGLTFINILLAFMPVVYANPTGTQRRAVMHNIRPAGQMWPEKTSNLAHGAQNFANFVCYFHGNTHILCKNLLDLALEHFKKNFWPAI